MADLIRALEMASLDGLPALQTEVEDGWLLRRSAGYSRRANCVMPLGPCHQSPATRIAHAEHTFEAEGLPCIVKLTTTSEPAGLDHELENRGYRRDAETLVLTRDLSEPQVMPTGVHLTSAPDEAWLNTWAALSPRTDQADILRALLEAITAPAIFVRVEVGGCSVGCGRAVISGDWVGLFDLAVDPDHRGRGLGRALADARLAWACQQGAQHAYLQVMEQNTTARRLQSRLGFREAYRYWYRIQPDH